MSASGAIDAGHVVISLKGRDLGRCYLVLAVEPPFVYVADGAYRSGRNPKKKRVTHVRHLSARGEPAVLDETFWTVSAKEQDRRIRSLIAGAYAEVKREVTDV